MKSKLLALIFCLFTLSSFAVNQVGICTVCHKPLTQCKGHAAPPPPPTKCSQCGQTNCRMKNNHKKCSTCGEYDFKCKYNLNHPCSQCGQSNCRTKNNHKKCSDCGEYDFKCKYKLNHPTCSDCERVAGAKHNPCEYGGKHPNCKQCDLPIGSTTRHACSSNGNHETCGVCHKPIGANADNSCEFNGKHPQVYEISFACNATGAKLYVDGEYISTLPLKQELETGGHELTIKADGYKEFKKTIFVGQDSEKEFRFNLESILPPAEGFVKDSKGEPLTCASIIAKGTKKGALADGNGHYSIAGVKKGQTLRVAFIGYKTVEQVWNGTPLNFVLKTDHRKDFRVGVTPTVQVGRTMAVGGSLEFLIKHFSIEAGYLYGLSSQDITWISDKYGTTHPETIRPVCIAPLRLGYSITADSYLRLTPQIGVNLMQVEGDVSGCYATSATAGLRADFTLMKHFGVTLTPEYAFPVQKSYTYQRLMDCGAKNFASGFNVRIGFNIFL